MMHHFVGLYARNSSLDLFLRMEHETRNIHTIITIERKNSYTGAMVWPIISYDSYKCCQFVGRLVSYISDNKTNSAAISQSTSS